MADRAAWVVQAWRRYHARQITWEELQALVREHRAWLDEGTDTRGA